MDEDIAIINSNTRIEKLKNFFVNNKKLLIIVLFLIVITIFGYLLFKEYKQNEKLRISDQYNSLITEYSDDNKEITKNGLIEIIYLDDETYSPLSLYFIIDNQLITEITKINDLFDRIIKNTPVSNEIRNLIIYKKALFNANNIGENELLEILKPIINSKSVWKSHALYLMAEYFYSKKENQKSKEFFNQLMLLENANQDLKVEAQKRLNRDLSE
tara:strand:- start:1375 stop:2019 length:645 start_codon:yes stop_codon:yes gene_type:complete